MSEPRDEIAAQIIAHRRRVFFAPRRVPWLRRFRWRWGDIAAALADTFERELQERAGVRWLAVAFCVGAAVYFVLPREPLFPALATLTLVFAGAAAVGYRRGGAWRPATLLAVFLAGATMAEIRVERLDGPQIERAVSASLSGRVVSNEGRVELRPRIVLDRLASSAFESTPVPKQIRLTLSERYGLPPLGSRVSLRARLMPVGGPIVPGGYDPHRAAFFDGIGGSGFLLGGWKLEEPAARFSADLAVARTRRAIKERIVAAEPGQAGPVAAALLVGDRSGLTEETKESLRIAGMAHILAISGLHMMLVAGTTYFALRALFALSPRLSLGFPIRKWAAVSALLVVTVYLALSGGGAATVRAYVMAAIVFGAILVDRPAISMRNLAIAAFVVVGLGPESVMEAGFQMSFGAVVALIAVWEYWRDRGVARLADRDVLPGSRVLRAGWRSVFAVALTTIVAGLATGPFAAYHFERVASYSLIGNLLAAPLVSLVIMPFGLLALVAMPFGLESLPLAVMGRGIDALLAVAAWVESLPGAEMRAGYRSALFDPDHRRHALALPVAAPLAAPRRARDRAGARVDPISCRPARHSCRAGWQGGRGARSRRRASRVRRAHGLLCRRPVRRRGERSALRRGDAQGRDTLRPECVSPRQPGSPAGQSRQRSARLRGGLQEGEHRRHGASGAGELRRAAGHRRRPARTHRSRGRADRPQRRLAELQNRDGPVSNTAALASVEPSPIGEGCVAAPQYFRRSPASRPWMRTRSGPKMRVS